MGSLGEAERAQVLACLDQHFPAQTQALNQELCRLLVYLEAPGVAQRTLTLLAAAPTQEEQLHYAYCLRPLKTGWTIDQRRQYFEWFLQAGRYRGGHSFIGFVGNVRQAAIENLDAGDAATLRDVIRAPIVTTPLEQAGEPRPFVRKWAVEDLLAAVEDGMRGRNFEQGRRMFAAAACYKCHRIAEQGGIIGPDLTGVGKRFDGKYLLEAVIEPDKVISDQYQATVFVLTDGTVVVGKVANLSNDELMVITNMLEPDNITKIRRGKIDEQLPSPVSMMPAGLVDTLTEDEILDLMAYLRSGGDRSFEAFQPAP
jgi:putative heme-binding domain-containing protein